MEKFINNHPFISLMMLSTICTTIGRIIRPDTFKSSINISTPREEKEEEYETVEEMPEA